jgi:class 3 adenylate cyclase/pimeloyl-ACP methyl ester carboxylesterase
VKCSACQLEAPADAEFCPGCGAPLSARCQQCGIANAPGHRFCKKCGQPIVASEAAAPDRFDSPRTYTPRHLAEKILTSRASLEGERKIVTVLFVDVSGFTALSERLDPEDVHGLMDRAFERMLPEIHRHEGTVNQFLGDGLMALFGAPLAQEDHPVQATRAALAIRRALETYREELARERGVDFRVRMGLNSGPVVVGKIGDNLRMDYTAVGDTTNLAARLLALAEPGQILVSDDLARSIEPYFVLEGLGEVAVKGKALPVRAHRVESARAVRSRLEAVMERGLATLVGRERELALLDDRFAEVEAGRGQVVFVFGEPGVGKSRLLLEFRRRAEARGARWLTGRCVSYSRGTSYVPIVDLVRSLLGIQESDGVEAMIAKIEAGVGDAGGRLDWAVPFLKAMMSVDPGDPEAAAMPPHQRRGRVVHAVAELLLRQSERSPVVLVIEDLHWIDPQSEEVLRALVEAIAAASILVLLTHRPGYTSPFQDQTYLSRITLRSLSAAQAERLVSSVLNAEAVPPAALELITRRAEGNPLFVEELSRVLVEDGTLLRDAAGYRLTRPPSEVVMPDTVQGVIMARIDRLPEAQKAALQVASVIGREFSAQLLERVAELSQDARQALGELRAVELIYQKSAYPELAYLFKHALTHDVAYESLLKQHRRALHRRAGEVIEELYPERLSEFYETLAWHYTQGELWPRAAEYCLKAARKARVHYAHRQAIRHCEDALQMLEGHGGPAETTRDAFELLGDLESLESHIERANEAYDRALALAGDGAPGQRVAGKRHRPGAVTRDGARIAYYEHGAGERTLLLAHPLFYGLGTYQPFLEELCGEFRIVTIDPRGTGRSDFLPEDYRIRDHAADIEAVIRALGGAPVVLIGISRAASISAHFAVACPGLVEKLILIGPPTTPGELTTEPEFVRRREHFVRFHQLVREARYQELAPDFWSLVVSEPDCRDLVQERVAMSGEYSPAVYRNFFLTQEPEALVDPNLAAIRMPTLVLNGDEDLVTPLAGARHVASSIAGAQLYVFKGRGHSLYATAPLEFARVVRSFVRTGRPT